MNDLISRAALIKEIENGKHPEFYDGQDIVNWQIQCIKNAPAVDAEPVRHGSWDDLCRGKVRVCVLPKASARNDMRYAGTRER